MHLIITDNLENNKTMSRKERLMILADLITDVCSYEEIVMLGAALIDASIKVRRRERATE